MGDGCLMEGISHEVCSLAGTLGLGKLIGFYDHNGISIDGETEGWFTDDTAKRFEAYHWHVVHDIDGHDPEAVKKAILEAQSVKDKPSLIICRTVIGFGSPNKAGKEESHGAALGEEEVALTRQKLGWHHPAFEIPKEIYRAWDGREKGEKAQQQWQEKFAAYEKAYPELAAEFTRRMSGGLPEDGNPPRKNLLTTCRLIRPKSPPVKHRKIRSMPTVPCCRNCWADRRIWRRAT